MTEKQRKAVELREQGMSYDAIGVLLGISVGSAYHRVNHAKHREYVRQARVRKLSGLGSVRLYKCGACGGEGHNRRSCTRSP